MDNGDKQPCRMWGTLVARILVVVGGGNHWHGWKICTTSHRNLRQHTLDSGTLWHTLAWVIMCVTRDLLKPVGHLRKQQRGFGALEDQFLGFV